MIEAAAATGFDTADLPLTLLVGSLVLLVATQAAGDADLGEPGFIPSRRSFKTRIEHWIAGTQA